MKFWELLQGTPRPQDPATGQFLPRHAGESTKEQRIKALAKSTDHLSPMAKELAMTLAKSDLTTAQVHQVVRAHKQRDDIIAGYEAILKAARIRGGVRARALMKRKEEDL